jgi:hypothetical protein
MFNARNTANKCPISRPEDLTNVPQLAAYLKYLKPKRFTLKGKRTKQQKQTCYLAYKNRHDVLLFCYNPPSLRDGAHLYITQFSFLTLFVTLQDPE